MIKTRYLILGAGPSGLTFATKLKKQGNKDFIIIEKENEVGGLCKSSIVDDNELDIGGGHFLDTIRPKVLDFLFEFMPEDEWNIFERNSKIQLGDILMDHPFESNIWQMPIYEQINYLKSAAVAGCNIGISRPQRFIDWIYWKFGKEIADNYMIPYNQKMFGENLNELGVYWLEKLPDVSFEEILKSCIEKKPYGKEPAHTKFYYPKKYGYGEVWRRMGKVLEGNIKYNECVKEFNVDKHLVKTDKEVYYGEIIVPTIPWKDYKVIAEDRIINDINKLKYTSIVVSYNSKKIDTDAHWIYEPSLEKTYHRILVRKNFLLGSKGYWTETNKERISNIPEESFINKYAYPINTIEKPLILKELLQYLLERNIYALGRWGEHQHFNSDVCVEKAMILADRLGVERCEL